MSNCNCQCRPAPIGIATELFQGATGASAYEIAVEHDFKGTEDQWLESLQGKDGADGAAGVDGKDGKDGADGKDGTDGVTPDIGVAAETLPAGSEATVSKSGELAAPTFTFGIPKGDKGDKGDLGEKGDAGDIQEVTAADIENLF